ncbi:MAG: Hsp70 family protein [Bacteroidota bacterium]
MIELFRSIPVEVLYTLGVILPVGFLTLLTFSTKTMDIIFKSKGYTEIYEQVDYSNLDRIDDLSVPKGKIRAPYGAWDANQESDVIVFELELVKAGLRKKSNNSVILYIDEEASWKPEGLELTLVDMSDGTPEPVYEDEMKIRMKEGTVEFGLEIRKGVSFGELNGPVWIKLGLAAETKKSTFGGKISSTFIYEFFIGPMLGKTWVGLDPGTSASCIAAGSSAHLNRENEVVIALDGRGNEIITPSQIKFFPLLDSQNKQHVGQVVGNKINPKEIPVDNYRIGEEAKNLESGKRVKSFLSVKKLLGYQDEQVIQFENGDVLRMTGKELTSMLVKKVYADLGDYIHSSDNNAQHLLQKQQFAPQRAVVAIPNNFTAQKIQDMLESVKALNTFKEVRYVYEAEAVLMYCLRTKIPKFQSGTLLIFDMGGATINATLVRANKQGDDYYIDILGKIGYGVGGDSIDFCLAKTLFEHKNRYRELDKTDPFRSTGNLSEQAQKEQLDLRIKLRDKVLEQWKIQIVKNGLRGNGDFLAVNGKLSREERRILKELVEGVLGLKRVEDVREDDFLQKFYHQFHQDADSPAFENAYFQKYIYDSVADATQEILRFLGTDEKVLDHVVFSGRSVFFPGIKQTILKTIDAQGIGLKENVEISLEFEEAKTAVAKGACLFGMLGSNIHLQSDKTYSAYGFTESESAGEMSLKFTELIPVGRPFDLPREANPAVLHYCQGIKEGLDKKFGLDGQMVNFYQVMDSDPDRIIRERMQHRYSLVASLPVRKFVDKVAMRVFENDLITCAVHERGTMQPTRSKVEIPEMKIAKDNEDHYTWLVQ